jgi:predicted ATPase
LNNQRVIITGGPGFGKTSIVEELEARKYPCVHEVSRTIIKEQIEIGGEILPWKNLKLFSELLLELRLKQFEETLDQGFTFFDRGIPDIIAYMQKDELTIPTNYISQINKCTYFSTVFIVPPWKEIFKNDAQRVEDYQTAVDIHEYISNTYLNLGYQTVVLPKVSVKERADFILNHLFERGN